MSTPTPLTDAEMERIRGLGCTPACNSFAHAEDCGSVNPDLIVANFARRLETELANAPHGESLVTAYKCGSALGMDCDCWKSEALARLK